jgi:hypothetical protein
VNEAQTTEGIQAVPAAPRRPPGDRPRRVRHPKPQHDAGAEPLDPHAAQSGGQGGARYRLTITRYGAKLLDIDNGVGGCKPLIDALRYEGLIPEDDPGTIELIFRQRKVPKAERRTEIVIETL